MANQSTTQALFKAMLQMVEPLNEAAKRDQPSGLIGFAALAGLDLNQILSDPSQLNGVAEDITDAYEPLRNILVSGDLPSIAELPDFIDDLTRLCSVIRRLDETLEVSVDVGGIGKKLLDHLLIRYLRRYQRGLLGLLELTGAVDLPPTPFEITAGLAEPPEEGVAWPSVDFGQLGRWLNDPSGTVSDTFHWGNEGLKQYKLLLALERLLRAIGIPTLFTDPDPDDAIALGVDIELDHPDAQLRIPLANIESPDGSDETVQVEGQAGLAILPLAEGAGSLPGFAFLPFGAGGVSETMDLGDRWSLALQISADAPPRYGVVLRPDSVSVQALEGNHTSSLTAQMALTHSEPEGERRLLIGDPDGVALFIDTVGLLIDFEWEDSGHAELALRFPIRGARLQIKLPERYGFLSNMLPEDGLAVDFDITVGWSSLEGLAFDGSATLDIVLPLHLSIGGVVDVPRIGVGIGAMDDGSLKIGADISAGLSLGPFNATVERIGLDTRISFPEQGGNFGPVSLQIDFKPPEGMGIAIDGGLVSGGGSLIFDADKGRYAGMLTLDIFEISLNAIGLLDTRRSDGGPLPSPGFSFLIIITGQFPPIQLGFGFALTGAGGLIGIHRTMAVDALQNGIRNGSADSVLFPQAPEDNMLQIISDVRSFFPVAPGRYVFGPMARLSWGTPRLIDAELGIFLEVPNPLLLVLLGQLSAALPGENNAIVSLNVDLLGVLDFANHRLEIDARLRDSRITGFPISGDMVLRLSWGDRPNFVMAIGGFNPHFKAPTGIPPQRRVTVSLGLTDNPRITMQGYMALTSNSVQFGARAELYAAAGPASLEGFLSFDALLVLDPFYFRFDFEQTVVLRAYGKKLAGVSIIGTISGPSPYHIRGRACVSILFLDVCVAIDVTLGERRQISLPVRDVWAPLASAISDPRNWNATLPAGVFAGVSLKAPQEEDAPVMVHPMGQVTLRQKVAPLNRQLEKFGEVGIQGDDRFDIASLKIGSLDTQFAGDDSRDWETVDDWFAPGQFEMLTDDEKLNRDSFESMVAGVTLGSQRMEWGGNDGIRHAPIEYECETIDAPTSGITAAPAMVAKAREKRRSLKGRKTIKLPLKREALLAMNNQGAKAQSLSRPSLPGKRSSPKKRPKAFTLQKEHFQIVSTGNMTPKDDEPASLSKTDARQALAAFIATHPQEAGRWQVIAKHDKRSVS